MKNHRGDEGAIGEIVTTVNGGGNHREAMGPELAALQMTSISAEACKQKESSCGK